MAAAVTAARIAYSRRCRVSAASTLRTLAAIAFADPADFYADADGMSVPRPLADIPPVARQAIRRVLTRRMPDGAAVAGYE